MRIICRTDEESFISSVSANQRALFIFLANQSASESLKLISETSGPILPRARLATKWLQSVRLHCRRTALCQSTRPSNIIRPVSMRQIVPTSRATQALLRVASRSSPPPPSNKGFVMLVNNFQGHIELFDNDFTCATMRTDRYLKLPPTHRGEGPRSAHDQAPRYALVSLAQACATDYYVVIALGHEKVNRVYNKTPRTFTINSLS